MAHIGVLCYKGAGHLMPLLSLARELAHRGHRLTFFLPAEKAEEVKKNGFGLMPVDIPARSQLRAQDSQHGPTDHAEEASRQLDRIDLELGEYLEVYLQSLRKCPVDLLIMGEITLMGPTVAELAHIPYVVISTSIPHEFGWDRPNHLRAAETEADVLRRRLFEVSIFNMRGPISTCIEKHRKHRGLYHCAASTPFRELAHITQWPRCLDVHRPVLPPRFHYAGPFSCGETRPEPLFPWNRLDGRSLAYVSLGTTKRGDEGLFRNIATACYELDLQTVIALGGRSDLSRLDALPGEPIVVQFAPQLGLIERADVVVTHAGPNTVLETLSQGKPMLALPLTLDQPAVAGHIERTGCAVALPINHRSVADIRRGLAQIRDDPRYKAAAKRLQIELESLSGRSLAADIVEREWKLNGQKETTTTV